MDPESSKVSIDLILLNVADELLQLCRRLHLLEKVFLCSERQYSDNQELRRIQDFDLIIQQISDLSRTVECVTEAELAGVTISTSTLSKKLHLRDLRDRLISDTNKVTDELAPAALGVHFF